MPEQHPAAVCSESPEAEVVRLRAQVAELLQRIQELEARLAKDSHNSSKPPSSDPPFKKPPPRSLRQTKGRKPGGQKGHPGATRELVTLRFDPSAPPQRPLQVCHQGQVTGLARVVETYANCFVKRERPSRTLAVEGPAPEPPASALRLRELARDTEDGEGR
jgi:hypothetical protein